MLKCAAGADNNDVAEELGVSADAVRRVWKALGLRPHRAESFSLSKDPQFVEKVRDIVGLHMSPPDNALVLCVDAKSQMQALDRSQPLLPMMQTHPEGRTSTYVRHGTTSLGVFSAGPGLIALEDNPQLGDVRRYQGWYRDPAGPCGQGSKLTGAWSVTYTP